MSRGWIAVDLDGTLARYDGYQGWQHIGEPIPAMVQRVKAWLADGKDVRIFTARVDGGTAALNLGVKEGADFTDIEKIKGPIRAWCSRHLGTELPITCEKDFGMEELWDDRCFRIERNTGQLELPPREGAQGVLLDIVRTFDERNGVYKDNYKTAGGMLKAMFPDGMPPDHEIGHLLSLLVVKISRFVTSGLTHEDSLVDAAAYAAMMVKILRERQTSGNSHNGQL